MNISISTAVLNHLPFGDVLNIYKKAGFEYIELAGYWKGEDWEIAQHLKGIEPIKVIQMVKESGLKISTFHDMGGVIRNNSESVVSPQTYEYIKQYDFPCIVFHTPLKKTADRIWWNLYKTNAIKDLQSISKNTIVCLENLPGAKNYFTPLIQPDEMLDFLNTAGIYANIDTTHYAQSDIDISFAANILKNRVKTIHISDFNEKPHQFIGEGHLDFKSFFDNLNKSTLHAVTIECIISGDSEELIINKAIKAKELVEQLLFQSKK